MSGLTATVERMARREAAVFFLRSREMTPLVVRVMRCPVCGAADAGDAEAYLRSLPVWRGTSAMVLPSAAPRPDGDGPLLTMLGCEALPARALLLIAEAAHVLGAAALDVRTRAVAWAGRSPDPDALRALDAAERWADEIGGGRTIEDAVLPVSTRLRTDDPGDLHPEWPAHRSRLAQHFLTTHCETRQLRELNDVYQRVRVEAASDLLEREAQLGY